MLVGFGYARDLPGFFAATAHALPRLRPGAVPQRAQVRRRAADPARARAGARARRSCPADPQPGGSVVALRVYRAASALAVVALLDALAVRRDRRPATACQQVPGYWQQTADLPRRPRRRLGRARAARPRRSASTPGATSTTTSCRAWPRSPWAVRNVVPARAAGQRGVPRRGHPRRRVRPAAAPRLASYLAANGVGTLVVRNDLDRLLTGAPATRRTCGSVLAATPGSRWSRSFGPVGRLAAVRLRRRRRAHPDRRRAPASPPAPRSIDVYQVPTRPPAARPDRRARCWSATPSPPRPGLSRLRRQPLLLAADAHG